MRHTCLVLPKLFLSYIEIWFWSNFFMGWSRFFGVTRTVRFIKHLARIFPVQHGSLDNISEKVTLLHRRFFFLFIFIKQQCLMRGFLLFFFGKRMGLDIRFRFGCQWEQGKLKTHCWILKQNVVCFEVEKVIKDFDTLVEYT